MKEPPPEATNQRKLFIEIQNISFHFYKIMFLEIPRPLRRDNSLPSNSDDQFEVDNMRGKLPWKIELYRSFDMEWNLSLMNTIAIHASKTAGVIMQRGKTWNCWKAEGELLIK